MMSTCPNCYYKLVFLSNRLKYKCAKCSRLFLQKSVENKAFYQWNKKQRELDLHNLKLEIQQKKRPKLTEQEKVQRRKEYYLKNKEKFREVRRKWIEENREFYNQQRREYWNSKSKQINSKRRERYTKKQVFSIAVRKARRHRDIELTRLQARIDYWKQQQKLLADSISENKYYKPSTTKLTYSVPTFLHCDLLIKS